MNGRTHELAIAAALCALATMGWAPAANAVPSFARQTGMACEACHTIYPELNHFGRVFKANGYTLDNLKSVRGITSEKDEMLALTGLPPISIMLQVSGTWLSKQIPDSTGIDGKAQNGTISFPQQVGIFYAGKIAPNIGAFVQLTYSNASGSIAIDNTDLRYANSFVLPNEQSLIYGVSLNNNPTVQDLWNSTPAFGFPYAGSNASVSPLAGTQINGALAQSVAGVSVYAFWKETLYGEVGVYRSAKQGASNPITGAAANSENDLTTWRVWGTYYYKRKIGGTIGAFGTTGSTDTSLYGAGAAPGVVTSANGAPDTKGWIAELNYVPWLNTKFSLQYTAYTKFNGGNDNYDGFGRKASDNNTIYALVWFAY
jgi:hypothetical protein